MVTNDDLYGIAERRGHVVVCESLTETPSFSLQTNKRCYIAIDQRLNVQQELASVGMATSTGSA